MTSHQFNFQPLTFGKSFPQPEENDFPEICFKYGDYDYVFQHTTPYVQRILDAAPVQGKHQYVVVDIKVANIQVGKPPCIPGWHCDTVVDPFHDSLPEVHHLFVTGNASLTQFIGMPLNLEIPEGLQHQKLLAHLRKQIDRLTYPVVTIPSCQWATYGRYDFHRGNPGSYEEKRLLVRVTETDVITPIRQPNERLTRLAVCNS
jgi:hypothetical protein